MSLSWRGDVVVAPSTHTAVAVELNNRAPLITPVCDTGGAGAVPWNLNRYS